MDRLKKIQMLLGDSFDYISSNYKIREQNINKNIDYLFFNSVLNSFVIIEIVKENVTIKQVKDMSYYIKYVDRNLKEKNNSKTLGIIIRNKDNNLILEYVSNFDIFRKVYKL